MMKKVVLPALLALVSVSVVAQVKTYGSPTPAPFAGTFDSGGQIPFTGNSFFKLVLHGQNTSGGGIVIGYGPASVPFGSATLLVNLAGATIMSLPAGVTELSLPIPNVPWAAGNFGYAQAGVFDASLPGGFGLTNALRFTVLPDPAPKRAYIPGQNFAGAPGLMTVLDLSVQPPVFRATGSVGFAGNITDNFPNKIAVAEVPKIAYALGNSTTNQFVRAFDISADPAGVVTHTMVGDIPIGGQVSTIVATHDLEVTKNGRWLFATSTVGSNVVLEVFNTSTVPWLLPTAPVQTITFSGATNGAVGLDLSPFDDRLAVVISSDAYPAVTLYDITPGGAQPLTLSANIPLASTFPGSSTPSDVHFTPDAHQLFITGTNGGVGSFSVVDVQTSPPVVLIPAGTWAASFSNLWCHGSAVALKNGAPIGLVGGEGLGASYTVIDLNTTSPTFGMQLSTFSTNPGANISNHRMHGRGSIAVAIDGTGALSDCEWVDVIDFNQPSGTGFVSWRAHMPNQASVTPFLGSAIPRDFCVY